MTMEIKPPLAVFIITFALLSLAVPALSASPDGHAGTPRVLVVCSDVGDVMFANALGSHNLSVDVLYLGKDLPDDRSKLSNILYLVKYDEIWIPDFNSELADGGRLNIDEIDALEEYVKLGGVLVLGLNTYVQSWSRAFEKMTGTRPVRVETGEGIWNVTYGGNVYNYDARYGAIVVNPYRARVIANFSTGLPAVTVSRYGRGVGVVIAFNPVGALLENPDMVSLYRALGRDALNLRASKPEIPPWRAALIRAEMALHNPLTLCVIAFLLLQLLAYLGFLPMGVTVILALPLAPFSRKLLGRKLYRGIVELVDSSGGITMGELAERLNVKKRKLKFPLAVLLIGGVLNTVDLKPLGEGDTLIVPRGREAEGVAKWALSKYPEVMERIAREPGVRVVDLAYSLDYPPYELLRILRELSKHGVIELRKVVVDYEVYPLEPLLRWFKE